MPTPKSIIDFEEGIETKHQVLYHQLAVYIFGVDVTPLLTSKLSIKYADRDGINSCTFSLSNQYNVLVYTEENQKGNFKSGLAANKSPTPEMLQTTDFAYYSAEARYAELIKMAFIARKSDPVNNIAFKVGVYKGGKTVPVQEGATQTPSSKFEFSVGSLVIHKFDPIRVFVKNPLNDKDEWYCAFAGFVDSKPYTQNYVNGVSVVNITCQDVRMLMQNMRTRANPAPGQVNSNVLQVGATGTAKVNGQQVKEATADNFGDLLKAQSGRSSHVLGGLSFQKSVEFIFHGETVDRSKTQTIDYGFGVSAKGARGKNATGKSSPAVCACLSAQSVYYNPGETAVLDKWNDLVLFGEFQRFLTGTEMRTLGTNCVPGASASPDHFVVRTLYPAPGAPGNNAIEYTFDKNATARLEFVTRYELLSTIARNVDYQAYVSGFGDFIIEFPMYDFRVSDFPNYSGIFSFDRQVVSDSINDEGGPYVAAVEVNSVSSLFIPLSDPSADGNAANNRGQATDNQLTETAYSMALISRLGVVQETISRPGITNQANLRTIALLELQKRISMFDTFDFTSTFRPFLGVNRPIYYLTKKRLGTSRSVSLDYTFRETAEVNIDLIYPKKLASDGEFKFLTGGAANPISYNAVYEGTNNVESSGMNLVSKQNEGKVQPQDGAQAAQGTN